VLKTIGFRRRQITATVAWQATTISVIALLIGVPVGVIVGRWAWVFYADRLGVVAEPVVAVSKVLLAVPLAIVIANLVAFVPGLIARRTKPAIVLRAE
jgi:predicted lysophospholipase L1 biosynthesis ABC-type transport system permease subunit